MFTVIARQSTKRCRSNLRISSLIISSLFIFTLVPQGFAASRVATYEGLLQAIRETRAASEARIEAAVEQEKVREAWETGKLIQEHVLLNKDRAEYGKRVIQRLAIDLNMSKRELGYMVEFARAYPIVPSTAQLPWGHYRELLSINDEKQRSEIATKATQEKWSQKELRRQIRKRKAASTERTDTQLPEITPGKPGLYRVVKAHYGKEPDQLVLDLGFSNYYRPPGKFSFKEGEVVSVVGAPLVGARQSGQAQGLPLRILKDASESELFTYFADVISIIDGDTFTAAIDLGFGITTVQKLRLGGLDTPEIETGDGKEAKAFVEQSLKANKPVLIKTSRSDKYDRYLADVWAGNLYLNQALLDEGLAVRVNE